MSQRIQHVHDLWKICSLCVEPQLHNAGAILVLTKFYFAQSNAPVKVFIVLKCF